MLLLQLLDPSLDRLSQRAFSGVESGLVFPTRRTGFVGETGGHKTAKLEIRHTRRDMSLCRIVWAVLRDQFTQWNSSVKRLHLLGATAGAG